MKKNDKENEICALCEHAVAIKESDLCICELEGAVSGCDVCGRFKPDMLKLDPRPRRLPEGNETVFVDV